MNKWLSPILLALPLGCGGDGTKTGNGISLELVAESADSVLVTTDASGTEFSIEEAWLGVTRIDLESPEGQVCGEAELAPGVSCGPEGFRVEGDFLVDLLGRTSEPPLADIPFPAGTYRRLDIDIDELESASELGAASFLVRGGFERDGEPLRFVLDLERNETLRYEDAGGVEVQDGEALVASLRVADWFRALPIIDCLDSGELVLEGDLLAIADSGGCSELENAFVDALRASTALTR